MDNSLFNKYKKVVIQRDQDKEKIITFIQNHTSITLQNNEITLDGKKITLHLSSIKKAHLFKKNIKQLLKEEGFIVS